MTRRTITTLLLFVFASSAGAQTIIKDTLLPAFEWQLRVLDFPYMTDAARTEAIRSGNGNASGRLSPAWKDYGNSYRNLSMAQADDMARNLHGSLYFGHNVLWNRIIKPTTTGRYLLNRAVANIAALSTDYLAIKLPYGFAFLHEEYHRAVMTTRQVYSFDEVWKFGKGLDIAVTRVKDEDLIHLKRYFPADQVRMSAVGVEGEYRFLQRMQHDNFFLQTGYPMVGLSILGTVHGVSYVNLPLTARFDAITDSILAHDQSDILARDFTGYDFSAWIYDLFRPEEPYEDRGSWPGGVGIKRPVHAYQLTPEMKDFLKETGRMQYLNFLSPFLLGINRLQLGRGHYFNFALRSIPTSSGYYAGGDFYLDNGWHQALLRVGFNRSKQFWLPALELQYNDLIKKKNTRFNTGVQLGVWLQPEDQLFAARKATFGFAAGLQPSYRIGSQFHLLGDFSYKTKGWVFGNPYLDQHFSARIGFALHTRT